MDVRKTAVLFVLAALALAGCGGDDDAAGGGGDLQTLSVVPCEDDYWSSEAGLASQTNCRLADACDAETMYVRLQIHAALDAYPEVGDYPVIPYGDAEPGTTRAYYVPDASNEAAGETAEEGTVTVDSVELAGGVISSVTVTVDVPFETARVTGTFTCPIIPG